MKMTKKKGSAAGRSAPRAKKQSFMQEFKSSIADFRQLKTIHIILFEVLFWFLFIITFLLGSYLLSSQASLFEKYGTLPLETKQTMLSNFVGMMLVSVAILFILAFIYWTATRYLIWSQLRDIKPKLRAYWKFLGANLLWLIILGIIFLLGWKLLKYVETAFYPNWAIYTIFTVMTLIVIYLWFATKMLFYTAMEGESIIKRFAANLSSMKVFRRSLLSIGWIMIVVAALSAVSLLANWIWSILGGIFDFAVTVLLIIWVNYYTKRVFDRITV